MNVLIAAHYSAPSSGNFIASLMDLGLKMREKGDELFFVFPKSQNTVCATSWVHWLESAGFTVFLADLSESNNKQLESLKKIISENKIDILHIHFGLFQNFAVNNRKELDVKIIVHEHMEFPAGKNKFIQALKYIRRSIIYRLKKISIVSVNRYVNMAHFAARHWFVPNGLSLKRHISTEEGMSRNECRKLLGIQNSEKLVMFLGWDLYRKGLDVAVKAVDECRKTDPNIVLGIVGLGAMPSPNREGMDYIKERTGISPCERWIRYLQSTEDMFAYHRAADAYLSSSRSEAFSYGILESISQNTPVAVSNIKGTSWCYKYSKTFSYSVEDYKECAAAIQKALEAGPKPSNAEQICREYSIEKWCSDMMQIYDKVEK